MPNHVMLDLETFSLRPNAVVFQIGARIFDDTFTLGDSFSMRLDVTSQILIGRHVDHGTTEWWQKQKAKSVFMEEGIIRMPSEAIDRLNKFILAHNVHEVWANSPAADCIWLKSLATHFETNVAWTHKQERDVRTVMNLGIKYEYPTETVHEAIADCDAQIAAIAFVYNGLNLALSTSR